MKEEKINIELKSEVLNEVLSAPPSWLVRSGNTLFFFIIFLLLSLCFFISYPDEIMGEVNILSNHPPVEFQNQMYGKLVDLRVKDQQFVRKGTVLVQFDNEINPQHITLVQDFLKNLNHMDSTSHIQISNELAKINLGTLQSNWINLLSVTKEWNALKNSHISDKKVNALRNEIIQRKRLHDIANQKLKLIQKDIQIQQTKVISVQRLFSKNAISKDEYLMEEKTENQIQQQLQNQREALVQNEIQLNSLQKSLDEMIFQNDQELEKLKVSIQSNSNTIQNLIHEWEKSTAWIAPFDGKIMFNTQLNLSGFYPAGEASLVIVPKGNFFIGLMKVRSSGAGKIKKGQEVFIELIDYPKNDYGMVLGTVKSITSIPKKESYEVQIQLSKKLITTYKKEIPSKAILKGNAKIITNNKRLIERFFEKVINLIEK